MTGYESKAWRGLINWLGRDTPSRNRNAILLVSRIIAGIFLLAVAGAITLLQVSDFFATAGACSGPVHGELTTCTDAFIQASRREITIHAFTVFAPLLAITVLLLNSQANGDVAVGVLGLLTSLAIAVVATPYASQGAALLGVVVGALTVIAASIVQAAKAHRATCLVTRAAGGSARVTIEVRVDAGDNSVVVRYPAT